MKPGKMIPIVILRYCYWAGTWSKKNWKGFIRIRNWWKRSDIKSKKLNTGEIKEPGSDDNIVDTDTETEHGLLHDTKEVEDKIPKDLTTVIAENRRDKR